MVNIGGKGLFIKELEEKLLEREIDLAVHSMKDVPAQMHDNFVIAAVIKREDFYDCFLSEKFSSLQELPKHSIIGTCSPRRQAQLKYHYNLQGRNLRGNIETRLQKMKDFDGIILADVALKRLHKTHLICEKLPIEQFLPAGGQGVIGVQCLRNNLSLRKKLQKINHMASFECITLERIFLFQLHADCHVPVGILVRKFNDQFEARIEVFNSKNEQIFDKNFGNYYEIRDWLQRKGQKLRDFVKE